MAPMTACDPKVEFTAKALASSASLPSHFSNPPFWHSHFVGPTVSFKLEGDRLIDSFNSGVAPTPWGELAGNLGLLEWLQGPVCYVQKKGKSNGFCGLHTRGSVPPGSHQVKLCSTLGVRVSCRRQLFLFLYSLDPPISKPMVTASSKRTTTPSLPLFSIAIIIIIVVASQHKPLPSVKPPNTEFSILRAVEVIDSPQSVS